jgi:polyhydroxybutyrate depolymerase
MRIVPAGLLLFVLLDDGACGHAKSPRAAAGAGVDALGYDSDPAEIAVTQPVDRGFENDGAVERASAATTETLTILATGRPRIVVVHVPAGTKEPVALVLNMHGSGGTASDEEAAIGMDQAADANGFIVAYPQGGIPLGGGFAWNVPGQPLADGSSVPADAEDDAAFLAAAIASLERKYPIDPKRVYATGLSGGGRMASQLGCDLSTIVAAIAPVAGLRFPSPCNSQRPVPVISFHGTSDGTNPYDGGGPAYWTYSVPTAAERWSAHNRCAPVPEVTQAAPGVQVTRYADCTAGTTVELYTISGAGHEWPGAPQQTNAIDANTVMWKFFSAHPLQ